MEEELLEKLKSGDKEAFIMLVDKYRKKVISLCYSYTGDYGEAEDLSQEAFLSLYKGIESFRGDSSLSTYLYRITINKCLSYKKRINLKEFVGGLFGYYKEEVDYEEKAYVRQCIDALSKDLKTPVLLYYYLGLSYKEISEILNISERAVEGRLYRAKGKVKLKIEKEEGLIWSKNGIL